MYLQKVENEKIKVLSPVIWGCSSAGRAPALQAGGQEFDPPHLHQGLQALSKYAGGIFVAVSCDSLANQAMNIEGCYAAQGRRTIERKDRRPV